MDARTGRRQKRISKKQEQKIATDLGGRTMAGSGNTRMGGGGDVRAGKLRVECKYTERTTYSLKYDELEKIRLHAAEVLESPVLQFAFRSRAGKMDYYAVIPWNAQSDWRTPYILDTTAKSMLLPQDYLRGCLIREGQRVQVVFRKDAWARLFEVLTWEQYLERNREDTDA